jgi:ferredoxin
MYLDTSRKTECYGCSACSSICPKSIIEMRRDNEGFLYPLVVDETQCTHCNLCRKVCPVDGWKATDIPTCYLGFLKDNEKRRLSTSGGAFMAIAEWAHDNGYEFFYGAAYDENAK